MKIRMFLVMVLSALLVMGSLVSCVMDPSDLADGEIKKKSGTVVFGYTQKDASRSSMADAEKIVVTFENDKSEVFIQELDLLVVGEGYMSTPLILNTGTYTLTHYLIVDALDNALFATPVTGSNNAYLVDQPLPINFIVSKDSVTEVIPEVVDVELSTPADFGYIGANFDMVETIDVLVSAMIANETTMLMETTTAHIVIDSSGTILYDNAMSADLNHILVDNSFTDYTVTISKDGYKDDVRTLTNAELVATFTTPLLVALEKTNTWARYYTEPTNGVTIFGIAHTSDGGYIVAADLEESGGNNLLLMKMDAQGQIVAQDDVTITGGQKYFSSLLSLDGMYLVSATSPNDSGYLYFFDESLSGSPYEIWGTQAITIHQVIQSTTDAGYLVIGETQNGTDTDGLIIKLADTFDIEWEKSFGGTLWDQLLFATTDSNDNYIVIGTTSSYATNGQSSAWVLKLDGNGDIIWQKVVEGAEPYNEGITIKEAPNGNYLAINGDGGSLIATMLDVNGSLVWSKKMTSTIGYDHYFGDTLTTTAENDGFILAASYLTGIEADSASVFFRIDLDGNLVWQKSHPFGITQRVFEIERTFDNSYLVVGDVYYLTDGDKEGMAMLVDSSFSLNGLSTETSLTYGDEVTTVTDSTSSNLPASIGLNCLNVEIDYNPNQTVTDVEVLYE